MSHWAEVDENNIVVRVLVGRDEDPDEGYQWLVENLGGRWIKTSYNTIAGIHINGGVPLRGNYAGIGMTYDEELDAFIPPKPIDRETIFNPVTYQWILVENETSEPVA